MKKYYSVLLLFGLISGGLFAQDKKASVHFDGVDDYIVIQDDNALNFGRSAFTIEAWITASGNMVTNGVVNPMILSKKGLSGTASDGFLMGFRNDGKVAFQLEGLSFFPGFGGWGAPGVTAKDLRDGVCHHVAWVREVGGVEDTVLAYQDGDYVKKTRLPAGTIDVNTPDDLWIGWSEENASANYYQFEGEIKEIRIWNYARSATEIKDSRMTHFVGTETGLIAYWRLNENFGQTVYDCSPNGNNGLMVGGPVWQNFTCDNMDAVPNNCANGSPLGLNQSSDPSVITVYPNPVVSEIRITSESAVEFDRVVIYDVNGQIVLNERWNGFKPLNVQQLETGTYFIQLSLGSELKHSSLISKK